MTPVDDASSERLIFGEGTSEATWRSHARLQDLPASDPVAWVRTHRRIWIVAPHPDDEILGLGATAFALVRAGADVRFVCVTDGEASHPDSSRWTPQALAIARRGELARALRTLGIERPPTHLGLPDGEVTAHRSVLQRALSNLVHGDDLVLVTWRLDGHPDHEACGAAVADACAATGATMMEYPVWMWHWARADERSIPWSRARRLPADAMAIARKAAAIAHFVTQTSPDETSAPILPPHVLARFDRPFEIVFV